MEGVEVSDILLDTGCSRTMVHADLVPKHKIIPGEATTVKCVHGDNILYPMADVVVQMEGVELKVKVAVSEELPVSVLLGTDVPELGQLLHSNPITLHTPGFKYALVTTRAQSQQQKEVREMKAAEVSRNQEEIQQLVGGRSGATEHGGGEQSEDQTIEGGGDTTTHGEQEEHMDGEEFLGEQGGVGASFSDDMFEETGVRPYLTRRMKRQQRKEHGLVRAKDGRGTRREPPMDATLPMNTEKLKELQETDPSLTGMEIVPGYFQRDGVMYRRWVPKGRAEDAAVEQIVLPRACRKTVLHLAHTIPLGGHLGRKKTVDRIMKRFYWPTLFRDVADFVKSCTECQKAGGRPVVKAPMIPLPVIDEPFERVAMDIVGPLPRSRAGHRYILVMCDYASRYPEAVPMRCVDAEHVAEELVKIFARVGLPKEILTDQGSNFTSELLKEMYRLLHVGGIWTSPYHPQTDRLVERFNGTLKSMLRKCAKEEGKDWDQLIPYVLFAYREAPQESTGFSPFELLYGREVRGPLDVIKEEWKPSPKSSESVVSHMLLMRE